MTTTDNDADSGAINDVEYHTGSDKAPQRRLHHGGAYTNRRRVIFRVLVEENSLTNAFVRRIPQLPKKKSFVAIAKQILY